MERSNFCMVTSIMGRNDFWLGEVTGGEMTMGRNDRNSISFAAI